MPALPGTPPSDLTRPAMNEINAARRMRVAALERAEAEKMAIVRAAEAHAEIGRAHV